MNTEINNNNNITTLKPFDLGSEGYTNNLDNSDNNSDSDEYIDLSSQIEDTTSNIFQFHLNSISLNLKFIGKSSYAPDIIIKENFGPDGNLSLYNCVYTQEELDNMLTNSNELFFPLVKLIKKEYINNEELRIISSIAVKINQEIKYQTEILEWELYWVQNYQSDDYIKSIKLDKDINQENILEKLIQFSI